MAFWSRKSIKSITTKETRRGIIFFQLCQSLAINTRKGQRPKFFLEQKLLFKAGSCQEFPARLVCVTVYCEETSRSGGKRGYASCLLITTHRSELGLSCPRPHSVLKTRICASSNAAGLCWTPSGGPFFCFFFFSFCHNHETEHFSRFFSLL